MIIITEKRKVSEQEKEIIQWVRLFDIFFIGPFLIFVGIYGKMNKNISTVLIIIALLTIIYNGYYFIKYQKENQTNNTVK